MRLSNELSICSNCLNRATSLCEVRINSLYLCAREIENDLPSAANLVASISEASNMNSEFKFNALCEAVQLIHKVSCKIRRRCLSSVYHSNSSSEVERYKSSYDCRNILSGVREELSWLGEARTTGQFFPGRRTVRPSVFLVARQEQRTPQDVRKTKKMGFPFSRNIHCAVLLQVSEVTRNVGDIRV